MVSMAWSGQEVRAETWTNSGTNIESQIRLSQWLNRTLHSADQSFAGQYYLPGLVWMVPEEALLQGRMKSQLLEYINAEAAVQRVSRADAMKLASFVESLPVTGRVVVEKTDPRWLEVNPLRDPVLHKGQRILMPPRPTSVTVVRGDGHACQVVHSVHSVALDYVRQCDSVQTIQTIQTHRAPQIAWIVQPDGLVQRRGVAGWNESEQDSPAPGAWIVADDPATPWPNAILEQLARLLATQGIASDQEAAQILPQPAIQNEVITGQPDRPRNLQLTSSDWGSVGLIQTPTARMESAGNASLSVSRVAPYTRVTGSMQLMDWLELSVRWTDIANRLYGVASFSGNQSLKDKSVDLKLKLSNETAFLPQLAVGVRDLGGTGLFSGEYVVASKRTGNLDWSLGLGWGYLGGRGNLGNPLSVLSSRLNTRQVSQVATGGQANTSSYFSGPTALFGGVQYQTPWNPLLLKLEYDGNDYQHEPQANNQKQTSPINVGLVYRWAPAIDLSVGWERGTTLGLGVSFHGDLSRLAMPKLSDPEPEPVSSAYPSGEPDWKKVAALLEEKTSWRVLQIRRAGSELIVRFERADAVYWNSYLDRIASILHRHVPNRSVMVFRIQSADYGLGVHEYLIDRHAWVEAKTGFIPAHHKQNTVFEQQEYQGFVYPQSDTLVDRPSKQFGGNAGLTLDHAFGGPEGLLYNIGLGTTGNWYFQPNTWWTGSLAYRLIDNYDKFIYPGSNSTLPRVRTHIERYAGTSAVTMPVFQLTHAGKLNNENFYSVYGGMLESMFGGVGAEWLYRPWQSGVAFGVDVNAVQQRGFGQDFSFQNYKTLTGHASLYWDTGLHDVNATLRAGRYLAGDLGATLDLSRVFRNGVKIGAFATKTNVSAAQFGEGSFDKGVYVNIPFDAFVIRSSANFAGVLWHPLTRDGGAILNRRFALMELTAKQGGDLLKWEPYTNNRKTQFGDVGDNFPETNPRGSVFTAASDDLTEMGRTATTPDFWRSMLLIGGVSLASSIADKPADKFAVRHGNSSTMKGVETAGNLLPVAAMGFSGMMFLAGEPDSKLANTGYSSLAAGGMGFLGTLGLKYAVGRARPNLESGASSFTPFSKNNGNSSFPSGHTTVMWAAITPYAKAYDAPWLYGVAALTNVARIGGRNHWLSDTVGGALLGYALGDFMWESQRKTSKRGAEWAVSPNGVTAYWKME